MLKRWVTAVRKRISGNRVAVDSRTPRDEVVQAARRNFFKKAAVGAVSITGTAGLAKATVDAMPKPDMQDKYIQDSLAGEEELKSREFVLMSDQEKSDMVQSFIDQYPEQG